MQFIVPELLSNSTRYCGVSNRESLIDLVRLEASYWKNDQRVGEMPLIMVDALITMDFRQYWLITKRHQLLAARVKRYIT